VKSEAVGATSDCTTRVNAIRRPSGDQAAERSIAFSRLESTSRPLREATLYLADAEIGRAHV